MEGALGAGSEPWTGRLHEKVNINACIELPARVATLERR